VENQVHLANLVTLDDKVNEDSPDLQVLVDHQEDQEREVSMADQVIREQEDQSVTQVCLGETEQRDLQVYQAIEDLKDHKVLVEREVPQEIQATQVHLVLLDRLVNQVNLAKRDSLDRRDHKATKESKGLEVALARQEDRDH